MPTQHEARSKYLEMLMASFEAAQGELGKTNEALRLAKLEDEAQALLTPAQRDALNQGGVTERSDFSQLTAERDRLQTLIGALQAMVDAVRRVS